MRYCWTYPPFLSLLFIFSCLDSGICLDSQEIQVMKNLSSSISSWKNNNDPCFWSGVNCTGNGSSVIELHMSNFGLRGNAWKTICQLQALKVLDVSNNFLSIPSRNDITACTNLLSLNISSNLMSGALPSFVPMRKLQFLDVSHNGWIGEFGPQIQNLTDLRVLNLTYNNFTGPIPPLGSLGMLEKLDFSQNYFSGHFLEELVNCTNLTYLDLSFNTLTGKIPNSISNLTNLKTLILSSNHLTGMIPETLSLLGNLVRFASNKNQLTGSIPVQLASLTGLQFLDLGYNQLNESIPPKVFALNNLRTLDLTANSLTGQIPQKFSSNLYRLRIGNNLLSGSIPITIKSGSRLTYLEMNNNLLDGQIPQEVGSCSNLQLLDLGHNKLTGLLPSQLASLQQLQVLKLPNNQFYGSPDIPSTLSNLSYFDLSGNLLSGLIPPQIFKLPKLQNLRLQDNNLTGVIPKNIQDGQSLLELQLGGNNLNGTIPPEIGYLPKLQIQLNLSCNSLEGAIPSSLSRLSTLEILDISNNKLTGEVPSSLTAMISLTLLNLSNNILIGALPNFRDGLNISCTGNPDLCSTVQCGSATATNKKKKASPALFFGVAIASAVFGNGAVGLFIVAWKYFRHKVEGHFIHPYSIHRPRIDFEKGVEATLDPSNVFLNNKFGTYYKAVMPSGISYSVKKLNWTDKSFNSANYRELGPELEKQGKLSHPNILTHLAHVLDKDCAYLFYEYVQKGCLSEFLHTTSVSVLDWPSRCSIAIGVAQGLAFLHGCERPILHLDLTAKNILLKSLTEPQIGDTELFKIIDPSKSTGIFSVIAGSVGYVPPEYAYTMRVTAAGNVYSFGVILLELLTGRPPITNGMDLAKRVQSILLEEETWEQILDTRIRNFSLQIQNEMLSMLKVALSCISSSPDSRPEMRAVVEMLQMVRQVAE